MKAQILKLAGVKTEAEFYKKFPTEEAFMKKHGKALKKAQVGAIIGEGEEQKPIKPLGYKKTMANSLQSFGMDADDPVFQNVINPQAKKTGFEKFAPMIAEGIESLAPQINEAMGVAKNGKKLKKAQTGLQGIIKPPAMPKVNAVNLAKTEGFGLSKMEDIPESTDRSFDYAGAFKKMPGALASQAGTIIGGIQEIQQNKKNLKKQQMYGKVSDIVSQAASSRPEQTQRRYVRPEDQMMPTQNPLGTGTNYLAQNGAMIGGNPTEIQNMYNPGDMYTDLGYEPLNDSNIKQYAHGGRLRKAQGGFSLDSLSGVGGGLGGMLGSQIGGGGGEAGPGSKIGSAVGGVLGMAIPIPGVGQFIGSTLGGLAGGLFDAPAQRKKKAAEEKLQNNLQASAFQSGAQNFQAQNSGFMEDGGYVSHDWTPQVITKFGDLDVSEVHTFAADGMPKYRAGGHLQEYTSPSARAMYTGRDLPYQMENGGQMAMGGDLQVHRGKAETMSYNPYLPGDGETIMFRGPSHDNGGMPVSFGNNGVEVEGGEPAIKMQNGGEADTLTVIGDMYVPNYGVEEIGDPKAKGKKFKHYFTDLTKQEAKQNITLDKSAMLANNADENDPFDRLSLASAQAMQIGANMKLKNLAKKKLDTVAVQNAILDTAKEFGLKSAELAKGKFVEAKADDPYAEFGAKLSKAQTGKKVVKSKYDPEFENFIDQAMQLEQANSYEAGNYRGGGSNFGTNNANIKTPEQAKEFYYKNYWSKVKDLPWGLRTRALQMAINTGDPYGELMVAAGKMSVKDRAATKDQRKDKDITGNKDWQKSKADILKAYNEDPDTFLEKLDAEQDRYYNSIIANNPSDINSDTRKEFFDDYVGLAKYAAKPYVASSGPLEDYEYSRMFGRRLSIAEKKQREAEFKKNDPVGYNKALNEVNRQFTAEQRMKEGDVPYPTEFVYTPLDNSTDIAQSAPVAQQATNNVTQSTAPQTPVEAAIDSEDIIIENPNAIKKPTYTNIQTIKTPQVRSLDVNMPTPNITMPSMDTEEDMYEPVKKSGNKFDWMNLGKAALMSASPFIRPSVGEPLDAAQLAPEMMAMSMNQLEPVQAQSFTPLLTQPFRISLQDQRNEVTAASRAAERMAAYNPAAASMIFAQAADAKNKINAEEFRMNQAEQARSVEQNRAILNDAQTKNLAIFDQQYVRQSEARSKTKQQAIEISKSISDKMAQNKLQNRTLGVYQNMFPGFSFTPEGTAYKNPLQTAFFNPGTVGGIRPESGGDSGVSKDAIAAAKALAKLTAGSKDGTARNGAIVKAIKNL